MINQIDCLNPAKKNTNGERYTDGEWYGGGIITWLSELAKVYKKKQKIHLYNVPPCFNLKSDTILKMGLPMTSGFSLSKKQWAGILYSLGISELMSGDLIVSIDTLNSNSGNRENCEDDPNLELIRNLLGSKIISKNIFLLKYLSYYIRDYWFSGLKVAQNDWNVINILTSRIPKKVVPLKDETEIEISW